MKIIVAGDTHGIWGYLNELIENEKPDIILQTGDFGYYPNYGYNPKDIKIGNAKLLWCDGNHEDFAALSSRHSDEVAPNIFYMPRGSTFTLPDGRVVLFMGGALSIDKHIRTPGYDWFPEEMISMKDISNLPDINVDIVISHTCPTEFNIQNKLEIKDNYPDISQDYLSFVLEKYQPSLWYFGHWHEYAQDSYENCQWTCLSYSNRKYKWYTIL